MEFTGKEVQLAVSKDLFPDLVERIRRETNSIITLVDIRANQEINPSLKVPFGDYYLEYSQSNGICLCTLTYRNPEKHQDDKALQELKERIKFF
ncbi:MAG: hypothetical protein KAT77_01225 [Nanoarchaeota archaeon]|nr:hypothetical protein [Nanoarchaeota archaeon]